MVKYQYIPEDQLKSSGEFVPYPDGTYSFEVIEVVEGDEFKDDRVVFYIEGCGRKGKKAQFFNGSKLWILVEFLKSIDRMDLYSQKGETNLTKTFGHKGTMVLETTFSQKHGKEYQNIKFVPWNKFNESNDFSKYSMDVNEKSPEAQKWQDDYVASDEIPF